MIGEHHPLSKEEEWLFREVLKALRQIKHGYIQLVVQDSRVVQIDKTEKVRYQAPSKSLSDQES